MQNRIMLIFQLLHNYILVCFSFLKAHVDVAMKDEPFHPYLICCLETGSIIEGKILRIFFVGT